VKLVRSNNYEDDSVQVEGQQRRAKIIDDTGTKGGRNSV